MPETVSLSELARRIGRDKGQLSRMARSGRLPREADGRFDETKVRAHFDSYVDPSRRKPLRAGQQSTARGSTVNDPSAPALVLVPPPVPDDYRNLDVTDDFARGAVFGAHRVAWGLPVAAACSAVDGGALGRVGLAAHRLTQADAADLVTDVCVALGLLPELADDPGPYRPTAFGGVCLLHLARESGEPLDAAEWERFAEARHAEARA